MNLTDKKFFDAFNREVGFEIQEWFENYDFSEANGDLGTKNAVSAVFSSNIEGNTVDLNTFMNQRLAREKFTKSKEVKEIEDLIAAYQFAQSNTLTEDHLLAAHKILSKGFLNKARQGKYRNEASGVYNEQGLVYLAVEPEKVVNEMKRFFEQINEFLANDFKIAEAFYSVAIVHLIFVHIHPFSDGNGRVARLLEKWFLAGCISPDVWKLISEKYYKEHLNEYYQNINLGVNFHELNYDECLPFLTMLPKSLT
ncbi:Fic family protein [candidate division KSB1 bacterium]|nr:Fic family protein [candidate division KSB1 bacterium]